MSKNLTWNFAKKYYKEMRFNLVLIMLMIVIGSALGQLVPWCVAQIINMISDNAAAEEVWQKFLPQFAGLVAVSVIGIVIMFAALILLQIKIVAPYSTTIRKDLFAKVLPYHREFWHKNRAGSVWSKVNTIRRTIVAFSSLGDLLFTCFSSVCSMIIIVYFMSVIYLPLGITFLLSALIMLCVFYQMTLRVARTSKMQENMLNRAYGRNVNRICNHFVVRIFGSIKRETELAEKDFTVASKAMSKNSMERNKNHMLLSVSVILFDTVIIVYAVLLWAHKQIMVGDVVYVLSAVSSLGNLLYTTLYNLMFNRSQWFKSSSNLEQLEYNDKIVDMPNAKKLKIKKGEIEFKNLSFAFDDNKTVIDNLNLKINAGEKVGIVGKSGGGKTTLMYLLQRLVNTPKGMIFIDGQDITTVSQESLHRALAFIPQDTSLFHRSIGENVSYGKLGSAEKLVHKAAKEAYAEEFIADFPAGYDTLVGDKGVKLSGGQRQRVGIARAMLRNAPILLLDEATSALDSESEKFIQKSLTKLIKNKTVLVVAHRLSTIKNMDRIVVIENGKIIEQGTPKELLKQQGKYTTLWDLQK